MVGNNRASPMENEMMEIKQRATIVQRLAFIGLAGIGGCEGCEGCSVDCHEAVEEFCAGCDAQGRTAFECNYEAIDHVDLDGVVYPQHRQLRATGCYETAAEAEAACAGFCNSDQWEGGCVQYQSTLFDCTGEQSCGPQGGGDEIGEAAPSPDPTPEFAAPSCDSGWFANDDVTYDRSADAYRVNRLFFANLLADPRVATCDLAELAVDATGQASLTGARPGTLAYQAGFRDGDIPVSVQGMTLDDIDQAAPLYWELRDADEVIIEVNRGGRLMDMTYIIE